MFEVLVRNPQYQEQFGLRAAGQGGFNEGADGLPIVFNPNIPQFILVRVNGLSATVEDGSLIIIEGSGTVSAVFPRYEWNRAIKVQPEKNVE
jgi:hypothetical protein